MFSSHQRLLLSQVELAIEHDIDVLLHELLLLSNQPAVKDMDVENMEAFIEDTYEHVKSYSVNDVAVMDSNGIIRLPLISRDLKDRDFSFREYYRKAKALKAKVPVYEHIVFKGVDKGLKGIILAMPVLSDRDDFVGVVLFTIRVDKMLGRLIPKEAPNRKLWVLDSSDNLLYPLEEKAVTTTAAPMDVSNSSGALISRDPPKNSEYGNELTGRDESYTLTISHSASIAGQEWTLFMSVPANDFSSSIHHLSDDYIVALSLVVLISTGIITIFVISGKALRKSHEELESRVVARTADLASMNEELEEEIAKKKKSERELRIAKAIAEEEKAKSDAIIACMGDPISIQSPDFQVLYQNEIHRGFVGDQVGEFCYRAYEGRERVCEGCPVAMAFEDGGVHSAERTSVRDDGISYFDITASPLRDSEGNIIAGIEIARDITSRKKAADKLKEAYSHLETLIEAIPYAVFFKDASGRHVIANEACCRSLGMTKEEFLGKKVEEVMPPDVAENCRKSDEEIMRNGKTIRVDEQMTDTEGNVIFLETIKTPLLDEYGKVHGLVGLFHNITWRKEIEEELRHAKDSLAKAQAITHIGNWEWDIATNKIEWSDEVYRIFGQNPLHFSPTYDAVTETMHPDSLELFFENINAALHEQTPFEMDYALIRPDGEVRIVHTIGEVIYDSTDNPIRMFGTIQDVTEKKMLEKEALRSAQLASVGELAAGVAHEINNPINGIINYAQILLNRTTQDENAFLAKNIIKEGDRISGIVRSLLSFARADREDKRTASIDELLRNVLSLTGAQLRKDGVILETQLPEGLPQVKVNRQQIEQVFLNIINNSRYALNQKRLGMHSGKTLSITTRKIESGGIRYVRVTFTDKGIGIPSHLIDKVTTTFFTTKPKGEGTGLGLSICQNILNDHGGKLSIESVEGEFASVIVDIPASETKGNLSTVSESERHRAD